MGVLFGNFVAQSKREALESRNKIGGASVESFRKGRDGLDGTLIAMAGDDRRPFQAISSVRASSTVLWFSNIASLSWHTHGIGFVLGAFESHRRGSNRR